MYATATYNFLALQTILIPILSQIDVKNFDIFAKMWYIQHYSNSVTVEQFASVFIIRALRAAPT